MHGQDHTSPCHRHRLPSLSLIRSCGHSICASLGTEYAKSATAIVITLPCKDHGDRPGRLSVRQLGSANTKALYVRTGLLDGRTVRILGHGNDGRPGKPAAQRRSSPAIRARDDPRSRRGTSIRGIPAPRRCNRDTTPLCCHAAARRWQFNHSHPSSALPPAARSGGLVPCQKSMPRLSPCQSSR